MFFCKIKINCCVFLDTRHKTFGHMTFGHMTHDFWTHDFWTHDTRLLDT